jgi:hypothetical protein
MKSIRNSKGLYWGLITTFFLLYMLVGFVSTLHSITFFQLANVLWMAVLLGVTYEVGQAAVLFSILMSDNNKKLLPWLLMILLTALQVTANVYASFKFMDGSGSTDWTYWQRSILFWLEADGPEMFKVVISWITGALLPVVALGMTALVAENLKLKDEQDKEKILGGDELDPEPMDPKEYKKEEFIPPTVEKAVNEKDIDENEEVENEYLYGLQDKMVDPEEIKTFEERRKESLKAVADTFADDLLNNRLAKDPNTNKPKDPESGLTIVKKPIEINIPNDTEDWVPGHPDVKFEKDEEKIHGEPSLEELKNNPKGRKIEKKPENSSRGWHLKSLHIDNNGDVYRYGQFMPEEHAVPPSEEQNDPPKKA